jgi:alpha-beta hydrolase superfamily lysophospholipase
MMRLGRLCLIERYTRSTAMRILALLLCGGIGLAFAGTAHTAAASAVRAPPDHFVVDAAGQQVTVWSRRPEHPQGAIVLVHGRTWSARPAFDFQPRSGNRSLMQALSAAGFATYAVDLPGYGSSPRDASGWLAPERAASDVAAVVQFVARRHPTLSAPVLLGWSRGSKISALLATQATQPLSALILYGYNLDPTAPPDNGPPRDAAPAARNTAESARSDFISPAVTTPDLIDDFVTAALATDPVRVDVCCDTQFLLGIHPEAIHVPTLLIHGARDPAFKPAVAADFFAHLASAERRWIIVAAGDHAAHLEDTAPEVSAAMVDFIRAALRQPGH